MINLNDFYKRYCDPVVDTIKGVIEEYKYNLFDRKCAYFNEEYMAIHFGNKIEVYEYCDADEDFLDVEGSYRLLTVINLEGEK